MRILILPRYTEKGPSSRVRMFGFLDALESAKIEVEIVPFFPDAYIDHLYDNGKFSIFAFLSAYCRRVKVLVNQKKNDLVWVQYELLPWMPAWMELFLIGKKTTLILDYDDAIFHRYDQHKNRLLRSIFRNKISHLMRRANLVIAGNAYIANYAKDAGAQSIEYLPSALDISRYQVKQRKLEGDHPLKIGWIGSASTVKYLSMLLPVFEHVKKEDLPYQLILIGASSPDDIAPYVTKVFAWQYEQESILINQFDVGIMPLPDEPFEKGKCGFKLLQYMACGLPVIASPIGANIEIVENGVNGFLAKTDQEWLKAFETLQKSPGLGYRFGLAGREKIEKQFSYHVVSNKLVNIFRRFERR